MIRDFLERLNRARQTVEYETATKEYTDDAPAGYTGTKIIEGLTETSDIYKAKAHIAELEAENARLKGKIKMPGYTSFPEYKNGSSIDSGLIDKIINEHKLEHDILFVSELKDKVAMLEAENLSLKSELDVLKVELEQTKAELEALKPKPTSVWRNVYSDEQVSAKYYSRQKVDEAARTTSLLRVGVLRIDTYPDGRVAPVLEDL